MGKWLTRADLEAIRLSVEAATSRPWRRGNPTDAVVARWLGPNLDRDMDTHYGGYLVAESMGEADREFVIEARNEWVPRLLENLERLREALKLDNSQGTLLVTAAGRLGQVTIKPQKDGPALLVGAFELPLMNLSPEEIAGLAGNAGLQVNVTICSPQLKLPEPVAREVAASAETVMESETPPPNGYVEGPAAGS